MSLHTSEERARAAADSLAMARDQRQPGPRVSERFALASLAEAYHVQALGLQQALAQGRRLSGAKAGLTSASLRAALKVEEPVMAGCWPTAPVVRASALPGTACCSRRWRSNWRCC